MQKLIKNREIVQDTWHLLKELAPTDTLELADDQDVIVPLAYWLENHSALKSRSGKSAPWIDSHELPTQIREFLPSLELVAINFPAFADGRGYSSARELRVNFGFKGEIRAIGAVLRDQLFYLSRCGVNAFVMREDQNLEASLAAFDTFTDAYQVSADRPDPLFRRRA